MISMKEILCHQLLATTDRLHNMCMTPSRNDPPPSLLCPNPLLIRSRGPHHLSYIINHTTTRHHNHNHQRQQPISQWRNEHTLSPIWPEPRQSHWSHQPKPLSHGSVMSLSLSSVSPLHRPHLNSTRCIAPVCVSVIFYLAHPLPQQLPTTGLYVCTVDRTSSRR